MLAAAGIESARLDARLLLQEVLAVTPERMIGHPEQPVSEADAAVFRGLLARRARREPIAYIVGWREFWSLPFRVTPATLVPRPESETLVETALHRIGDRHRPLRVLDLGTGSGCLLLALLSELPRAWGLGVDCSPAALTVARDNAVALGLAERTAWLGGDWTAALAGPFDLVVTNPPYVARGDIARLAADVRDYEPRAALDGGTDGLGPVTTLAANLACILAPGAPVVVECGAGQAPQVAAILAHRGFVDVGTVDDLCGIGRCVSASAPRPPKVQKMTWKPIRSRLVSGEAHEHDPPMRKARCSATRQPISPLPVAARRSA